MTIFRGYECLFGKQFDFCNNAKVFTMVLASLQKKQIQFSNLYGKRICNTLRSSMMRIIVFLAISGTEYAL